MLIGLAVIYFTIIPKSNVSIRTTGDDFLAHEADEFYRAFVTGGVLVDGYDRLDQVSLP